MRLQLRRPDFSTAARIVETLNKKFEQPLAQAENAGAIRVSLPENYRARPVEFIAALEHVVGKQERIAAVCIGPDDDMEQRRKEIIEGVREVDQGAGVVILEAIGGAIADLPDSLQVGMAERRPRRRVRRLSGGGRQRA